MVVEGYTCRISGGYLLGSFPNPAQTCTVGICWHRLSVLIVIVIVISKFLKRYSKAKRTREPAYSRALRRIKGRFTKGVKRSSGSNSRVPEGDRVAGMLILVLVLVLKDSLRTFFKSLSWSLWVRSLSLSLSLGSDPGGPCPCPGPLWSAPCPYPGPCGLVLVLVLVFSPYKDLFPLFHYSDLFA